MKHFLVSLALAGSLAATSCAAQSSDVRGWGRFVWGMSPEQARDTAGATAVVPKEPLLYEVDDDSLYGLFRLPGIQIGRYSYRSTLIFDKTKARLTAVILNTAKEDPPEGALMFESLRQGLIERYGSPAYEDPGKKLAWNLPFTIIELEYAVFRFSGGNYLSVFYRERPPASNGL